MPDDYTIETSKVSFEHNERIVPVSSTPKHQASLIFLGNVLPYPLGALNIKVVNLCINN